MTIPHQFATDAFLAVTVLACWLGVLGMWRMRKPIQALHYLSFPAAIASIAVTIAVGLETGFTQATAKCIAISAILIATTRLLRTLQRVRFASGN